MKRHEIIEKKAKAFFDEVDKRSDSNLISAMFGKEWPKYAKEHLSKEQVIGVAHKNGKKVILLEQLVKNLLEQLEPGTSEDWGISHPDMTTMKSMDEEFTKALKNLGGGQSNSPTS